MLGACLVVAALFVWRNAICVGAPGGRPRTPRAQDIVQGAGAAATGFVSLLKRNIPTRKLVADLRGGSGNAPSAHRVKAADLARVEALAEAGGKQPVQHFFQMITQILNEEKK